MKKYIYRIYDLNNVNICYIGSTSNPDKRFKEHHRILLKCNILQGYKRFQNMKLYQYIQENGGWDNFKCEVVFELESSNNKEVFECERNYINQYNACLNLKMPYIDDDERREKLKIKSSKYYNKKRSEILEQKKSYYEKNRDKIKNNMLDRYYKKKHITKCETLYRIDIVNAMCKSA